METSEDRAALAIGLALASLVVLLALGAAGVDGPIWVLQGLLAAGAIAVGLQGRKAAGLQGRSLYAVVGGVILLIAFAIGTIAEFA